MTVFSLPPDDDVPAKRPVGWPKGRRHSDATKAKISASLMGRKRSEETKARIRAAQQCGLRDRVSQLQVELNQIREELSHRPDLKPSKQQNRVKAAAVPSHEYPEEQLWR
jgi:hypothetical protein